MTSSVDIGAMRKPYKAESDVFDVSDLVSKEPFANFDAWFKQACEAPGILEANAMTLATATKDGRPSARMVLLKGYDKSGFRFFTNYGSRKAQELEENPYATLMFYWESLTKSVRVEGRVEGLSEAASTEYFHSRPKSSQIGACVSRQSTVIRDRQELDDRKTELEEKYADVDQLPKPDYWGGYVVVPERVEFWQGQTNRIHDRIVFSRPQEQQQEQEGVEGDDGWRMVRLAP